jgi:hypothetical protein
MADLQSVVTPQLAFLVPSKTLKEMNDEGVLQTFMEVWLDTGSSLVDAFTIAEDNRTVTVGTEQLEWIRLSNKLDMELQRHQGIMGKLRAEQVVIKPPTLDTMEKVDAISKAVGALQSAQARAVAALSAVNAALSIARQVQGSMAAVPAAAPAPTAGAAG